MKADKSGLIIVAAAAVVLYMVVKKSTPATVAAGGASGVAGGQMVPGSNNASFLSQWIAASSGIPPAAGTTMSTAGEYLPNVAQFGLQTFGNGSTLSSSGVADIGGIPIANLSTGAIYNGAGGIYGLSPTMGYGGY